MYGTSKKYLVLLTLTLASLLQFLAKAQTLNGPTSLDVIGNPFSQPNITLQIGKQPLEWYGSGDVNNDGKIDSLDMTDMNNGVVNDMADVDGDGTPSTQADKNLLADYLGNSIPYLPGHWNELTTRSERKDWARKMRKLQDPRTLANGNWVCADFIMQMEIDFYGLSNIEEFIQNEKNTNPSVIHSSNNNAKFNIPLYYFASHNTSGVSHALSGILVGDNPLNFSDWLFFNYYHSEDTVKPGDFDMDANHPVTMLLYAYLYGSITKTTYFNTVDNIIIFDLNNGNATLNSYDNKYLTINNPNGVTLNLGNLEKIIVDNNGLPTNQNYTPEFLESRGYKAIPDTTNAKTGTDLPIELTYTDRDTTWFSSNHYQFFRDFLGKIYFGGSGATNLPDSTTQEIEIDNLTPIEDFQNTLPKDFRVYQNYPNPFNPSTTIRYELPKPGNVTFKIYDITGKELRDIVQRNVSAGAHEFKINMLGYASGFYLLKVEAIGSEKIIKLNLVK